MIRSITFLKSIAVFLLSFASVSSAYASDPMTEWKTIETPHFYVIFDSKQQSLGQLYALKAEQAFAAISPTFGVWPEKTVVFVDDSVDLSNGSASVFPYPMINAYPVLPLSNDVVGSYGDWGLELLTHEYTHILNFTPANGIMKPLRWVFGSIVSPNMLLPRWYSEGLAVEMETRYSKYGRLRSSGFLSIARAMSAEGKLRDEDIGRINESIPDFPGGNRAYLMGALIWDELTRKAGDKIIGDLNTAYSRRIPFFINGPLDDRLGLKWKDVLDDVYDRVERRTREQLKIINAAGAMKERLVARDGYYSRSAAISPNGQMLAFVSQTVDTDNLIMLMHREGSSGFTGGVQDRKLVEAVEVNKVSWFPDSSGFIYDAVDTTNRYYLRSDLYRCELKDDGKKCKIKKLTRGLRAREPVVSPDGLSIVFVQNTPGSTRLMISGIDGKNERVLFDPSAQTRLSSPAYVSADELVYSQRTVEGLETLRYAHLRNGVFESEPVEILKEFAPTRLPTMSAKGLTFVSEKSGAANLYLADSQLKSARAMTNTISRILDATIDPLSGDVLYSRIEASGAALFALNQKDAAVVPRTPPTVSALIDTTYPGWAIPQVSPPMEIEDYHPSKWLFPRYWFPYAYSLPGGVFMQASTSGGDPVGHHEYGLTAAYDTSIGKPSFFGSYLNQATHLGTYLFSAESINENLYASGLSRQTTAGSVASLFYLPGLSNDYHGLLGWEYLQTDAQGFLTRRNGADVGLSYADVSQRGYQISPEKGGSAAVTHRHYFESLGNIGYDETDISASKYLNWLLPDHHVAAFFTNFAWAPALNRSILGRTTVGGNYQNGVIQNAFVMRGYQSGVFLGRDMLTGTFEYRFPILYSYKSFGTAPFFFRRLHAAMFLDSITLDGFAYRDDIGAYQRENFGTFHLGTGLELKADTTLFYFLPVQLIVGAYYGLDPALNQHGVFPFVGLGI